ncbi:tRNA (cytosine(32)/uridine(32)-2'-O)-methyltransferase TrmJ [Catenovulum adriaticum]|uniref:tRNA (cytidine/uridine-2'-O-)-methyltransferase TrmJ n=1 Tax=Catenovulum adriaticum TaxID=2984846 RepID=A0ABY7ALQ6_9ALTE|nr:tRNA (cytosine(32)/uridine(32)-2'-O)-methyltransferase TrmJ [Catenovulum sp. TS8]WAJ69400.1 tRNA (cytosine(32)/uridine(32)-2'-O)-methyltransferase TrmJ [Catenovulum sp. TS8]
MLDKIRIILINTSHTGNIGSTARAMKTMGLSNLWLVDPVSKPDSHSSALAAGATDVLGKAKIVDTLDEALAGCRLVIATSARSRTLAWPELDPRESGIKLIQEAQHDDGEVALIFGRENNGLNNEELQKATYHAIIPANPDYSSLNLAAAVQTLCYEVRMAYLQQEKFETQVEPYPLVDDMERFYKHLEETLIGTEFIVKNHPGQVMSKLKRLFNRARPESHELNILRGMLASVDKLVKNKGKQ